MQTLRRLIAGLAAVLALALLGAPAHAATKPVDVLLHTALGDIVVRLEPVKAPVSTRNFLSYVDSHAYDGGQFYRIIDAGPMKPGVIQGGMGPQAAPKHPPIAVESTTKTGLHNVSGEISMARTMNPVSATSEFFICIGDDTYLDANKSTDGIGYTAFGHVVRGYDVVLKIHQASAQGEALTPPVKILRARRL